MPQLSFETYVTQYFWLIVILGVFYYYIATQIVPKIGEIKKTRAKIASDAAPSAVAPSESPNIQLGILNIIKKSGDKKIGEIFDLVNRKFLA